MHKKTAFLFPGQGAQYVGMMKDFYEAFSDAKRVFEEASDLLKVDLPSLIFQGPLEVLTQTKNSQIAIFVCSYAVLQVFEKQFPDVKASFAAGLSLGEYTALVAAKKVSFASCLPVVAARGQYMNEACLKQKGTLHVVLGMAPEEIEKQLLTFRKEHPVWIANLNCPGQVVIAGDVVSMAYAQEALLKAGAKRVLPLEVSGAFHSPLMQSAKEQLKPMIEALKFQSSPVQLLMNVPGALVEDPQAIQENLINQVTSPVYWEKGIRSIMGEVSLFIEMGPGKTLQGMNKRIGTGKTISIEKINDLEDFGKVKDEVYASA